VTYDLNDEDWMLTRIPRYCERFAVLCWFTCVPLCGALAGPETQSTRIDLESGHCLVQMPHRLGPHERAPLIVCLHGTETNAADILTFWRSLEVKLPVVIVAPQGVAAGWRDADLPLIREMVAELLPKLPVDRERVLLTGHSAGGAMTFHLLYREAFPCTAVAVTANYVPPGVTGADVAARAVVPVFYAVGERDLNRPKMRDGLDLLRDHGARVTVSRPPIGHRLDRGVGQAAMDWWMGRCRAEVDHRLRAGDEAFEHGGEVGERLRALDEIVANRGAHFDDQALRAASLSARLHEVGRARLAAARIKMEARQLSAARDILLAIESDYRTSSLQAEARVLREEIESDASVQAKLRADAAAEATRESERIWASVRDALAAGDKPAVRRHCQTLVTLYPQTPRGREARELLDLFRIVEGDP
jgi:poly(3-hydroxybutyrate) depolymerase